VCTFDGKTRAFVFLKEEKAARRFDSTAVSLLIPPVYLDARLAELVFGSNFRSQANG
jgi:hypothetical protein